MHEHSSGKNIFYLGWLLKDKGQGQTLKLLKSNISQKRYETERKCQQKLDRK